MFPDEETLEAWNRSFTESVYDMDFSDTLYFVEDDEVKAV
jgi:hypothetical protein